MRLAPLSHILPYFLHCIFDRLTLHLGNDVRRIQRTMIAMAMMVKTCPTAPTVGEHSPPRQLSYVSFRGSGRLAFQHLRYHLLLSRNAIPVGPRPSHRFYPVRRRSICHRLAAQSRSLGLYRFLCRSFLRSGFNLYCELNKLSPRRNLNHFSPRSVSVRLP
jgi:hypothetical protein